MKLPRIGLGTWELRGAECTKVVRLALKLGYHHIDTAHSYQNHEAIHQAIKGLDRTQFYITSKIAIEEQVDPANPEYSVEKSCEQALKELGVDFLDLYLIHAPNRTFPLDKIFMAMEKLVTDGKIRKAGVSNYTIHHLEDLRKEGFVPFANQVEFHPYLNQKELLDYCRRHHIELISYRPFGKGKIFAEEPLFEQIGNKHGKSGAQVILRWLIQKDIPVIPKASSEKHLRENLDVFDFVLTKEEMSKLDHLHRNKRFCRAENPENAY
jgi:2,5-diketo-D-gluconate reductase B